MPAPLDLRGRRFGRLVVLRRDGRVKFGRDQTAWHCQCDCGATLRVPQDRLPSRPSIPQSHVIDACLQCRAKPCVICATPVLPTRWGQRKTCSPACSRAHQRRRGAAWKRAQYHGDTQWREQHLEGRHAERRDPKKRPRILSLERVRSARKRRRIKNDPVLWARQQARMSSWYLSNWDAIWARRRARLDAMTADERAEWLDRMRDYGRDYAARRRARIQADPQQHRAHLALMREYRRQRALAEMLAIGAELERRGGDTR